MASYQGHLAFSTTLGAVYGGVACWKWHLDWGPVFLGTGLTALGGLLPDLDSDSGVPVRELSGLAAAVAPFLLVGRLESAGLSMDQILVVLAASYLFIRYAVAALFKAFTVHRGMFHSLPAMAIAGLLVFLTYHHPNTGIRLFLAAGTMLGFFSHLVLDELCSVDFMGARLTRSAGTALKLYSSSWTATLTAYALLGGLLWLANGELDGSPGLRGLEEKIGSYFSKPTRESPDPPPD
jgi:LexA-binding, inner membrane-associated putative hydrolase